MISITNVITELGYLTANNSFRQIGLIMDPYAYGTSTLFDGARAKPYLTVNVSSGIGIYSLNETVYQGISINTATFSGAVIDFDPIAGILTLNNIVGTPTIGGILYGFSSSAERYITSVIQQDLQRYTGQLFYLDNEPPILRNPVQTEQLQLIIQF